MIERRIAWASFVLALGLFASAREASAFCQTTTESGPQVGNSPCVTEGTPLEWRNSCISYAVDWRGSQWMDFEEVEEAVDRAFAAWTGADCDGLSPNLVFKPLPPSTCKRVEFNSTGNVNTIAFLGGEPGEEWKDPCADEDEAGYPPRALAVTSVTANNSTGEILDVDIMINDTLAMGFTGAGPYANCPDTGCPPGSGGMPGPVDLRTILTHEIGHFIGIGHSDDEQATMFGILDSRQSVERRTLAADDIEAVCTIYPPGDLDASCDATPVGGLLLNCETDEQGEPLACRPTAAPPGAGNGCSAASLGSGGGPAWASLLASCVVLTALRRQRARGF